MAKTRHKRGVVFEEIKLYPDGKNRAGISRERDVSRARFYNIFDFGGRTDYLRPTHSPDRFQEEHTARQSDDSANQLLSSSIMQESSHSFGGPHLWLLSLLSLFDRSELDNSVACRQRTWCTIFPL